MKTKTLNQKDVERLLKISTRDRKVKRDKEKFFALWEKEDNLPNESFQENRSRLNKNISE